ncbi:Gfo/Idh/MocA family oxidoreductase [Rubripirellula amarantea]|uniref:1,5-anhydro-D-fructose reductase n=1 Tax=Rubripirellula amarantea TaxID=2527999 RepID=A0A5C5WUP9_9BACT|nr:Gfo/Idh/MocA family oxidoreductase [Rubripirellula amarantea]MDA8743109.1 Gfo/Idh/MocA family oxidoreductase [Rubripirellula amarantea]TWT53542.1 1,5-anhydro-D-fructose reductase [Rubripirellula amarantea]
MRVGIVGVGFMSWIHYLAYQQSSQAELVAFCSRDDKKRSGDWRGIQGNFGPPGEQIDVSKMNVFASIDEMLKDDSIDVIDVCLPPSLHADVIRACYAAGKTVFCEKPLALNYDTAHALANEAKPGQLMVAHVLPLMNEFALVYQAAQDGRYGKPIAGRFKRTISPPDWIPDFYDPKTVGGPLVDLHVHDAHLIRVLFGMPTAAHCVCTRKDGVPKYYETVFAFEESDRVVSCGGGVMDSPARPFTHGYEVTFEKATIQFEFAAYADGSTAHIPVTVLHNDGTLDRPDLGDGDPIAAFLREVDLVATCFHSKNMSPILDPKMAADALKICEMQM